MRRSLGARPSKGEGAESKGWIGSGKGRLQAALFGVQMALEGNHLRSDPRFREVLT
jgi:hypothetical protein